MAYPNIDPVFLKIGPLSFRWYGLMYAVSFILAAFLIPIIAVRKKVKITKEAISDLLFYAAFGVIVGGRFGYILFYNPVFYFTNPSKLFAVWEGGMSFHGGLSGAIIAGILFCQRRKYSFYELADISMVSVSIGLGLGRIGNFINGELFGRPTNLPWCMVFPQGGNLCRHPSQLYQAALEGCAISFILWFLSNKDLPRGTIFWSFILLYGLFRFLVEFVRQPDAHIGFLFQYFSMGQLLSLPMFVSGAVMLWFLKRKTVASTL
ncbi:MAG: prolipoprotein diacylglyceryl transferase [Nitrospirae bacterium]|nr:prolipoprotein diacylglyceryl transferase [Candidatus Troglogloeales bacterium]MBI3598323.1 prolipoprotein diacylglyceryl transferase [Candidatus Troglogloeales bacterium]